MEATSYPMIMVPIFKGIGVINEPPRKPKIEIKLIVVDKLCRIRTNF